MKTVSHQSGDNITQRNSTITDSNPEMRHCSAGFHALIYFLVVGIVASQTDGDGSSPEEICPCQLEESCPEPRHIFGRDPLDIQNFGLISPCKTSGEMPCCPEEPPPPKEVKLTAKDFEGFTPAELVELGVLNNTIGSASLPLAPQMPLFNEIPPSWRVPVDLKQPGAESLAPAGATLPDEKASSKAHPTASQHRTAPAPAHAPAPTSSSPPKQIYPRPMYQPPVYRPTYSPAHHQPPPYYPRPQPYYPRPQPYYPRPQPYYTHPQPYYPRPAYYPPYRPPPQRPYYPYRMY